MVTLWPYNNTPAETSACVMSTSMNLDLQTHVHKHHCDILKLQTAQNTHLQ